MHLFKMLNKVSKCMESFRSRFFWGSEGQEEENLLGEVRIDFGYKGKKRS